MKHTKADFDLYGYIGTQIFSGYFDIDYQSAWRDLQTRCETVEKMKWGNSTIGALLEGMKAPILASQQYIEPWSKTKQHEEHAEFIRKNFFDYVEWSDLHVQLLSYFEYGFFVGELVFEIRDGLICLKNIAPRIQSSIEAWTIDNLPWVNGHPVGITQRLNYTDDAKNETVRPIPWEKLFILTNRKQGINFEGESVLRKAYTPYFYIDLIQKIAGISIERYGVGLPYAKVKGGSSDANNVKLENLLKGIRSNEQAYALLNENVEDFGILTPAGGNNDLIDKLLNFFDKKLYDSSLAGFLNLSTGQGGSNALSENQSGFFLRSLQSHTKYIEGRMSALAKQLIIMNFGEQEGYPCFKYSDLATSDVNAYVVSANTAKTGGLVTWQQSDEMKIRSQLGLPEMDEKTIEAYEKREVEEETPAEEKVEEDKKKDDEDEQEEEKEMSYSDVDLVKREKAFIRNISDYENYLASEYSNIEQIVLKTEQDLRAYLVKTYEKADTVLKDGEKMLENTTKNRNLAKEATKYIDEKAKALSGKLIDSTIQNRLFEKTKAMATYALEEDAQFFKTVIIDGAQWNSYIKGYISNVEGVLFNEPRRLKEKVELDFGSQVSQKKAIEEAEKVEFNRNILKLSTITHARAAYNGLQFTANTDRGFVFFKVVAPKNKLKTLSPSGMSAELMYKIYTPAELTAVVNDLGTRVNTAPINGLNIHHGSWLYFYAIASVYLQQERERAEEQRTALLENIDSGEE